MHDRLYEIRRLGVWAHGLFSRNFGSEGEWHLLKTFFTYEEAERYMRSLV